ncbi:MAG TPA: Xaa-Pro dipeptidase [Myxococcales bacterium]|nr:Xaa-Pro dipeptidase [Myxococcales bacterium]
MDGKKLEELHRAHVSRLAADTARVLQQHGFDALVVHSGAPQKWLQPDDNFWPLRTTPEFRHWAPLHEAGCALVVESGRKPRLIRPMERSFWEDPAPPETDHFWSAFDVVEVANASAMKDLMPGGRAVFIGDEIAAAAAWGIDAVNPRDLVSALDQLRVRKTPYEIECLAEANRRAAAGHEELKRLFADAERSELELHLAFLNATRQDDAETPYKNIVAFDAHAATLHHVSYAKKAQPAQSMLVDAGAAFAGYASDVTRTWVKGKGATAAAFAQLVAQVEAMQQRLCSQAHAGLHYEALHDESHRQVGGILREVGIVKRSAEDATASGITRAFFPHGLGHSLGLQVHDVGCATIKPRPENPFLRNTTVIAEHQCFTIEPGIYFIDSLLRPVREGARAKDVDWKLVDALASFGGVRIEDDVVVRADGLRNLTREVLPKGGGAM